MPLLKEKFSSIANASKDILAITGALGLIYAAIDSLSLDSLTSKTPKPDLIARPICEKFAGDLTHFTDGSVSESKLIGIEIKASKDVSNVRARLDGAHLIKKWAVSSNSLNQEEVTELFKKLPTGKAGRIYFDIPRLMANTDIIIQYTGITATEFNCTRDWFQVSAPDAVTYHSIAPDSLHTRELSYDFQFNYWKYIAISLAIILFIYIFSYKNKSGVKRSPPKYKPSNPSINRTAKMHRILVPYALRATAARYFKR